MTINAMIALEHRAVAALASIFGLRMLGLFLVLPVIALYAGKLEGHTPLLIGFTVGIYGLTQALLQILFGALSDRFGRKPIIVIGLLIFAFGSVVAALADSIYGVILGRALQGAGAIAAAILALLSDVTREQQRTKAMALIGITIGGVFMVSLMLGPVLTEHIGVDGIFWLTFVLALVALPILLLAVPTPLSGSSDTYQHSFRQQFFTTIRDPQLLRLDFGIFVLHLALGALFVVMPSALVEFAGLHEGAHWKVYVPVLLLSVVGMLPLIMFSSRNKLLRWVMLGAIAILVCAQLTLIEGYRSVETIVIGMWLFFVGFNALEAMLPSLLSRLAPPESKGTALGVYSTFEFLGVFVGAAMGGWLSGEYGVSAVFVGCGGLLLLWMFVTWSLSTEGLLVTVAFPLREEACQDVDLLIEKLNALAGVAKVTFIKDEGMAYLQVDRNKFDNRILDNFVVSADS